jgi:hypothetical protein
MALGLRGAKGVAAAPYTAGPYETDQFYTFTAGLAGANTHGEIRYVSKNGSDGNDGKSWTNAKLTIQNAVDSLTGFAIGTSSDTSVIGGHPDIVFVGPGKWKESVYISGTMSSGGLVTMKGHNGLKVIAIAGAWETQMRPGDATTKYSATINSIASGAFAFVVGGRSVEIAGFCMDGGGTNSGVYVGDGVVGGWTTGSGWNASDVRIHDCVITGSGEGRYGVCIDGASSVHIYNNIIERWLNDAVCLTEGQRTDRGNVIENNSIIAGASGVGVRVVAGSGLVQGTVIKNNSFTDTKVGGSAEAFGTCIICGGAGTQSIVGNQFGTAGTKMAIQATDYLSGNFECNTSATAGTYVTEA